MDDEWTVENCRECCIILYQVKCLSVSQYILLNFEPHKLTICDIMYLTRQEFSILAQIQKSTKCLKLNERNEQDIVAILWLRNRLDVLKTMSTI